MPTALLEFEGWTCDFRVRQWRKVTRTPGHPPTIEFDGFDTETGEDRFAAAIEAGVFTDQQLVDYWG